MLLRVAALSDLPELLDVQQAGAVTGLANIFPQDAYPFPRAMIQARWEAELADPQTNAYVVEEGGRIVGFAATRGSELLHFGTAVETWGTGLAARAHDEVVARLVASGVEQAWLRVFEENGRARRFYEKHGWQRADELSRTPFPPHPVLVKYVLRLAR